MNRGTLMVLKRLLVTALGALGLGALATGPTFAQQVPAPDFFNNQVACSTANAAATVPNPIAGMTGADMMGASLLDQALRAGSGADDDNAMGAYRTVPTGTIADSLNFVIDATVANCGQGSDATAFAANNANLQLASGYTMVLTQFEAVVREENAVKSAQMTLNTAIEGGVSNLIEDAREALADAQADLATEQAKLNAIGAGPIYQAGIMEWRAKGRVDAAVTKWDAAVPMVTTAQTSLGEASYGDYVVLPGQSLLSALTNAAGELQRTALGAYLGDTTDGITAGFDEDGNLILTDSDNDDVPDVTATVVSTIMSSSEAADRAVTALQEAIADTSDQNQARRLGEALRRAQLEKSHLNEYLRRALNDNTELDTSADPTAEDYELDSIRVRNAAYQKALGDRNKAEAELRAAVAARHMATGAVQDAFQGPGSYYDQYVARHNYLVSQAQKVVNDATDDGRTATKTETDALADARKALETATMNRDTYQSMVADSDNPAVALISALLEPNSTDTVNKPKDDDGQAVVNAVSDTYKVAKDARDTANRVSDEVSGLTGEGGDVAMNTQRIGENAEDINTNTMSIDTIEAELAVDEDGMSRIDHNEKRSMDNRTMIGDNVKMIETNAKNILTNTMEIGYGDDGMSRIDHNEARSNANKMWIDENASVVSANHTRSTNNESMINDLSGSLNTLTGRVNANDTAIMGLQDQMEVVRAGVAASMALAGMPAINGRGISIGVGSYDGESAFAVGFQIQGEMASFKVGVTSAGGETGASAGVGFQF